MSDFFSFSGKLDDIVLGFDSVDDYKVKLVNLFTLLGLLALFFQLCHWCFFSIFTINFILPPKKYYIFHSYIYIYILIGFFILLWLNIYIILQNDTTYFGAIVGRVANRIGRAQFTLDGTDYKLVPNDGRNMLHGAYIYIC